MRTNRKTLLFFIAAILLLLLFIALTACLTRVDVQPTGPEGSSVGFASCNARVHAFFGVHMGLYTVTDWAGLVPIALALSFAALGLSQWIKRKSLLRVDKSILALGCFCLLVGAAYVFFEFYTINYRPVLIDGRLETSYPSSTTMLALTILPTAMMQFSERLRRPAVRKIVNASCAAFCAFMVAGRLLCGVHWASDILGGLLLSGALVFLYAACVQLIEEKTSRGE